MSKTGIVIILLCFLAAIAVVLWERRKASLSGTGYAVRKPAYLWMTEDALRQDYARYESAEQLDSHMSHMEHRGDMVMGDTRIEALDHSLFDRLK